MVVNVDYTIAPDARRSRTLRKRLAPEPQADRLVFAGDSAGAQIAAQTAAMLTHLASDAGRKALDASVRWPKSLQPVCHHPSRPNGNRFARQWSGSEPDPALVGDAAPAGPVVRRCFFCM